MSQIDLAVLGKNLTLSEMAPSNMIHIHPISCQKTLFKSTFFDGNNFQILPPVSANNLLLIKIDKAIIDLDENELNLYDSVLNFAAEDLEIDISAITNISKVDLFRECNNLTMASLCIISSLKWADIEPYVTTRPIVITVVLTNQHPDIKNICVKFTYSVHD
jgi:hypothetical protein